MANRSGGEARGRERRPRPAAGKRPRHPVRARTRRRIPGSDAPPEVVWLRIATLSDRTRRELDRIVTVAIAVADRDGIEALSMRRLATELRSGTTTLYRYVSGRDELIELMVDAVYAGEPDPLEHPTSWRDGFRLVAREARAMLVAHPWLAAQLVGRPTIGPNALRGAEFVTSIAIGLTRDPATAAATTSSLLAYVLGSVAEEIAEAQAQRRTGVDERTWRGTIAPWLRAIVEDGRYPAFARVALAADRLTFDDRFAFGLERLLDGFERLEPIQDGGR